MRITCSVMCLCAAGCLDAPPMQTGGEAADAGSQAAECAAIALAGADINIDASCDIDIEGLVVTFTQTGGGDSGCWIDLIDVFDLEGASLQVGYGDESDLSVVVELYSEAGNVVVNRWGSTFELNWNDPDGVEFQPDTTQFEPDWTVWRIEADDGAIRVLAGASEGSLAVRLTGERPFDSGQAGIILGSWDTLEGDARTASFQDLAICR